MQQASWPELPLQEWQETYKTLHMWTQIVGKIRLEQMPWINHSWHVTLYITARGLTTSVIPYGRRGFQIDFDFIEHELWIRSTGGEQRSLQLRPRPVSDFYGNLMQHLDELDLPVQIDTLPNEVEDAVPFEENTEDDSYEGEFATRFWKILVHSERVMQRFRAQFLGKCSPVHFFWGSFDLAVTRFSGRNAPPHPGGIPNLPDWVAREAYSHEVCSSGFWPGGGPHPFPLYYTYIYPEPNGFSDVRVKPGQAFYSSELLEFVVPYDDIRRASDPDAALFSFLESTYDAAAESADWDREQLERKEPPGPGFLDSGVNH